MYFLEFRPQVLCARWFADTAMQTSFAFSPSMVLMTRCSLPTKSLFFLELLRPSDRLHDHRSCIGNHLQERLHGHRYSRIHFSWPTSFMWSLRCRELCRHAAWGHLARILRSDHPLPRCFCYTLELQRSCHACKSIPRCNQGCRRVHGQHATTLPCMTQRTGSKETVAFGSGLHGHSFLWLQSPTINAPHPQTNSLCVFLCGWLQVAAMEKVVLEIDIFASR